MMKRIVLLSIALPALAFSSGASAQLPGIGGLGGSLLPGSSQAAGAANASSAPATHKNAGRKFHFTIPAGWSKTNGDPNSENVIFRKGNTSLHFQFNITPMAADFPAEVSVTSSLNSAKQDIKLGKNVSAKRRDDKCESSPKTLCARGWELIDSGNAGPQRIIWQAYDKSNAYFNFMASAEKAEFSGAQAELQGIIDSIKFE